MEVAVIGGGIAGMSAAFYLQKNLNAQVDIYERSNDIGGLAGTLKIGDSIIEKYYHHIFTHDKYYLDLVKDLNLEDKLIWKETMTGFYTNGTVYPFATPFDLLKFKPLNFISRIRFGLSTLFISKYKNIDKMENMTTEEFMVKIVGKQVWDVIWKPMLRIKFGENYNKIPAVWIWERIVQRFRSRSDGGQKELLGYMEGSFHTLNEKLLEVIKFQGASINLNSDVQEIVIKDNICEGLIVNNEYKKYDFVLCTAALPVFVNLIKNASLEYKTPLEKIKYDCALVSLMVINKKLSDIYWLNISDNEIPYGGLIEHTNFISSENYDGKTLLYFSKYLSVDDKLLTMKDEEILKEYIRHLKKIHPHFKEEMIEDFIVSRDRYAQPIWPMQYSKFKPQYKTPYKGLYLANTSQIYPNDRGMNFSVKLGKEVSEAMMN
ncbi:NAD(P)/FAD-dependent oxidoreductase [Paenibacillus filicis]|uniref:NAD(P)/FAD-dependent oxidoreductase n=1 Tax=Paenibacillus gyeongsangnamensis TaxID=3388067 RepID=A0ABT4Q6V7_9BACL|nr:NAD(P)/FAD-dependent oxidoreductase [Paenibacillus filicis]MCZ8512563.1 NAD(P)/FAD-dependent oxidoreductase [Paenibacillus filicis]